jgi:hypothetical protein
MKSMKTATAVVLLLLLLLLLSLLLMMMAMIMQLCYVQQHGTGCLNDMQLLLDLLVTQCAIENP